VGFLVKTDLIVKRFVLAETLADVGDFDPQIELFEGERIQIELSFLGLNVLLLNRLAEELSRVQELLKKEPGKLAHDFAAFSINVFKVVLSRFLLLFATSFLTLFRLFFRSSISISSSSSISISSFMLITVLSFIMVGQRLDTVLCIRDVIFNVVIFALVHHSEVLHNHYKLVENDG